MYYLVNLRYYFLKDVGIDAAVKNNDFMVGLVISGMYLGYNINKNTMFLNLFDLF